MKEIEEKYIHFVSCINNLNNAWKILQEIEKHSDIPPVIKIAAFRFAIIEYSKPYRHAIGKVRSSKNEQIKYILGEKFIPLKHLELHRQIINARDKIHSHSDLNILDANIYVTETSNKKYVGISQNIISEEEEIPDMAPIISLIEETLDNMYEERKKLKEGLPISSPNNLS